MEVGKRIPSSTTERININKHALVRMIRQPVGVSNAFSAVNNASGASCATQWPVPSKLHWLAAGISAIARMPVGAVASEGALAVGGWDQRDHIEPVEAMAEAALQLCHRPAQVLSGRIARSLPLLAELGVGIRGLDGGEWQGNG